MLVPYTKSQRHLGQLLGLQLAGHLAEADDAEVVARELRSR